MNINYKYIYAWFLILGFGCSDPDDEAHNCTMSELENIGNVSWISEVETNIDDQYRYILSTTAKNRYVAVSPNKIMKFCNDGSLEEIILDPFKNVERYTKIRIYKDKIYIFNTNDIFSEYNSLRRIQLNIYDFNGTLVESLRLNSNGIIYDVRIEDEFNYGMLLYEPDKRKMNLKRVNKTVGVLNEIVLGEGTGPAHLYITDQDNYLCYDGGSGNNIWFLNRNLDVLWIKDYELGDVHELTYSPQAGIIINGYRDEDAPFNFEKKFVAQLSLNGETVNTFEYDLIGFPRSIEVINDNIVVTEINGEGPEKIFITVLNSNFEKQSFTTINGDRATSNIIKNEINGLSFIFGKKTDLTNSDGKPLVLPRLFKTDQSYTIPDHIIYQ